MISHPLVYFFSEEWNLGNVKTNNNINWQHSANYKAMDETESVTTQLMIMNSRTHYLD